MKKKVGNIFLLIAIVVFIASNLMINSSFESENISLRSLIQQSSAILEYPDGPGNGLDGYCEYGCIYYWSDDGMTIWYGMEIICNTSGGSHCDPFIGCSMGSC